MLYAYLLENTKRIYEINNRPLFELIRDCHLKDERIFIDSMGAAEWSGNPPKKQAFISRL